MVRERVGDWRLAWRFALAGVVAGLLVIALAQTGVTAGTFDAAQDRLYSGPKPDPRITLVAIDQASASNLGGFPLISNAYHAQVIDYLMSLHPSVILFDVPLNVLTAPDPETHEDTNKPLVQAITAAASKIVLVCSAEQAPQPMFETGELIGERVLATADAANAVRGVALRPDPKSTCPENEADEPAFLEALRIAEGITDAVETKGSQVKFGRHRIPLVDGRMLINFTLGSGPTCTYGQIFTGGCPHADLITNHIVVVGEKLIDAGDVYSQPVSFAHDSSFCPPTRQRCMLDNQNYGYRIQADAIGTVLLDRYVTVQPDVSIRLAVLLLATLVGLLVYLLSFRAAALLVAASLVAYYTVIYVLGRRGILSDPLYAP